MRPADAGKPTSCPLCEAQGAQASRCPSCGAPLLGCVVAARYQLQALLGKGGMGAVYKAWDATLEEQVAFKMLLNEALLSDKDARRFRREIKLARKIRHPNVCAIHEYGESDGLRYIVMEFVEGVDLWKVLRDEGLLPPPEAAAIVSQVAEGLQAIHDAGILHRDLKPQNVMRDPRGVVRIMDFGIAKPVDDTEGQTALGQVMGTPEYMSPEQARSEALDFRSDVYALGVVAFQLLTGELPFRGKTPMATLLKVLNDPLPLDGRLAEDVPPAMREVLRRALAKDRGQRYATVRAFAAALSAALGPSQPAPQARSGVAHETDDLEAAATRPRGTAAAPRAAALRASARGCRLVFEGSAAQPLLVRPWPKVLAFGRGGGDTAAAGAPGESTWGHVTLREAGADAERQRVNAAISRRHLLLRFEDGAWALENLSPHMPVRAVGQGLPPRGRIRLNEIDGALEFQMLRRFGTEPETILTLRLQAVSGPQPAPSLWIKGPAEGIAAGESWLLVGGPVDSRAILPDVEGGLFTLQRREGGLELVAVQPARGSAGGLPAEAVLPLEPGLALSWPALALRCEPVPMEHEAFLYD